MSENVDIGPDGPNGPWTTNMIINDDDDDDDDGTDIQASIRMQIC